PITLLPCGIANNWPSVTGNGSRSIWAIELKEMIKHNKKGNKYFIRFYLSSSIQDRHLSGIIKRSMILNQSIIFMIRLVINFIKNNTVQGFRILIANQIA